jgi:tRNA(fMet)-specific endonuclease VapC
VTYGELRFGAEKGRARDAAVALLHEFQQIVPVIALGPDVAEIYGQVRAGLERRGEGIGNNDTWIAAHAVSLDVRLVTNNEREFRRVPGLTVENWAR